MKALLTAIALTQIIKILMVELYYRALQVAGNSTDETAD
jgi:hypothetical protein